MSRRNRNEHFEEHPRAKRKPFKFTFHETLAYLKREMKRKAIALGHILDPRDAPPRFEWLYEVRNHKPCDGSWVKCEGSVHANTRSEARSLIKKGLGQKLVPGFHTIIKVDPDADCSTEPSAFA